METVPKYMYMEDTDEKGEPTVTAITTTPNPRTSAEFTDAIWRHSKGQPTPGFVILPAGSIQERIQRGYQDVNAPLQAAAPQVGRKLGELNTIPLLLSLAAKARMVPQGLSDAVTSASGTVGETLGRLGAEQVNTLPKAGMTAATLVTSPLLAAPTTAGMLPKASTFLGNTLKAGLAGLTGAESARYMGGQEEEITPIQGLIDFSIAAAGGSAQTLISQWLVKSLNKNMGEKVAAQMVEHFKSKNPAIGLQDNIPAIATSSKQKVVELTQMGAKGLRESLAQDTDELLAAIKGTLPGALPAQQSVNYQATLRAGIRKVIRAQNEQLDNIDNAKLFQQAGTEVQTAITELGDSVRGFVYQRAQPRPGQLKPPALNMDASAKRVESILQNFNQQTQRYRDGAQVLHYMREANTQNGLDFQALADMLRGVYTKNKGSSTYEIGRILGQGRELTEMPITPAQQPLEGTEWLVKQVANLAQHLPVFKQMSQFATSMKAPVTPWPTQQAPAALQPLINFGAQEAGQAAIRSFFSKEE